MTASTTPHGDLSRIDVARIRLRLLAMREELAVRRCDRDILDLKRVEAALQRMARGVYGRCEACQRPVLKARLFAVPHARYCALCSNAGASSAPRSRP